LCQEETFAATNTPVAQRAKGRCEGNDEFCELIKDKIRKDQDSRRGKALDPKPLSGIFLPLELLFIEAQKAAFVGSYRLHQRCWGT